MNVLPPFQVFLDSHRRLLYRFLLARVGPNAADDCFQDTLMAALRGYPELPAGANLKTWVLTIAERKAIDHHRREAREARRPPVTATEVAPADGYDPALWDMVRGLPPKQRSAVLYRYVADLPYAEIAALADTSEAAARQNVRAGLQSLRKVWTP